MQIYLDNYEVDTKSALIAISHTFHTNYRPIGDNLHSLYEEQPA